MSALILNSKVKQQLDSGYFEIFQTMPERYFSAPGRTEISGNHTLICLLKRRTSCGNW